MDQHCFTHDFRFGAQAIYTSSSTGTYEYQQVSETASWQPSPARCEGRRVSREPTRVPPVLRHAQCCAAIPTLQSAGPGAQDPRAFQRLGQFGTVPAGFSVLRLGGSHHEPKHLCELRWWCSSSCAPSGTTFGHLAFGGCPPTFNCRLPFGHKHRRPTPRPTASRLSPCPASSTASIIWPCSRAGQQARHARRRPPGGLA